MKTFLDMITNLIYIFFGILVLLIGIAIANPEVITRLLVR
jgi:hypothetical protein